MLGECGCRTLHLSCWPILPCFCVSSQTYACVRVLWGRDPPFFFFFWHSIWHSRVWIHNQLLYASIKHFWHEHYLRTNQTSKTTCCSCVRLLCTGEPYPLRSHYGAGFHALKMWRRQWFREFSCPTSHPTYPLGFISANVSEARAKKQNKELIWLYGEEKG